MFIHCNLLVGFPGWGPNAGFGGMSGGFGGSGGRGKAYINTSANTSTDLAYTV